MKSADQVFGKCARRLIPLMALLYIVNFLDRVNVGFAALTMNRDLVFSPTTFGVGAGILFVGFFFFSVPSCLLLERIGLKRWLFGTLLIWGLLSATTAFVTTPLQFYALRFVLGAAEAGFVPGMIFYLTQWFPPAYRARFGAGFLTAAPISFIIGSPLSGFILGLGGLYGLHGWQWLFLIEGLPSCILAFIVFALMPNRPDDATWLSAEEKSVIAANLSVALSPEQREIWRGLLDPRIVALGFVNFGLIFALYGLTIWLPQIVQAMGFSILSTSFIVAVPFIVSVPAMAVWGRSSDRTGERIWHVAFPLLFAAASFVAASMAPSDALSLLALSLAVITIYPTLSPVINIPTMFLSGPAAAGGTALCYAIGMLGAFGGPTIMGVIREQTGGYTAAMLLLAVGLLAASALVLAVGRALAPRKAAAGITH